jgi:hypothetical protein
MGVDPMNKISIIIRILFAVTLFQQIDHVDPIALIDVPRDIAVNRKRHAWAR